MLMEAELSALVPWVERVVPYIESVIPWVERVVLWFEGAVACFEGGVEVDDDDETNGAWTEQLRFYVAVRTLRT